MLKPSLHMPGGCCTAPARRVTTGLPDGSPTSCVYPETLHGSDAHLVLNLQQQDVRGCTNPNRQP